MSSTVLGNEANAFGSPDRFKQSLKNSSWQAAQRNLLFYISPASILSQNESLTFSQPASVAGLLFFVVVAIISALSVLGLSEACHKHKRVFHGYHQSLGLQLFLGACQGFHGVFYGPFAMSGD